MKVMIAFPPLPRARGIPQLTQNRQFQWFNNPSYAYPVIPASAATLLKEDGFDVDFVDGIAQRWSYDYFIKYFCQRKPDLVMMETKTPIIRQHWQIINALKAINPDTIFVLVGDHVTALPKESIEKSNVDYVIVGGDFDLGFLKLVQHLSKGSKLPSGLWYRNNKEIKSTGGLELIKNLDELPFIDRTLTKFWLYYENYYKRKPYAFTMAGRDCPWHKCSFCSWTTLFHTFRCRSPENLLDEIGVLINKHGVKEIFDDTGTFPPGKWLEKFCKGMIERNYNEKILFSCNFRVDYINSEICKLMKKAGFRLLLLGLESAQQRTLDRIQKGVTIQQIIDGCRKVKKAGLDVHLTIMLGYPWETREDALNTLAFASKLFREGLADTLQATAVIPYPGTPLYDQALQNNWFRIDPKDYDGFDMTQTVLKTPDMSSEEVTEICNKLYKVFLSPNYVLRRFAKVRSWEDIMVIFRGFKAVTGHIKDFGRR